MYFGRDRPARNNTAEENSSLTPPPPRVAVRVAPIQLCKFGRKINPLPSADTKRRHRVAGRQRTQGFVRGIDSVIRAWGGGGGGR